VVASLRSRFREAHRRARDRAARYAVLVVCEDVIINGVLEGRVPLALSTWRGGTGLSELPPIMCTDNRSAWAARVHIDLMLLRSYACAVYSSTDAYLARLTATNQMDTLNTRVLEALLMRVTEPRSTIV
jgi:hypothetical protein